MPNPRPTSAESLFAVPPPACQACGSTDDVEMCEGRRGQCRTRTCPEHRRICEGCGVILCLKCSEQDVPAPVREPYWCGACYQEVA